MKMKKVFKIAIIAIAIAIVIFICYAWTVCPLGGAVILAMFVIWPAYAILFAWGIGSFMIDIARKHHWNKILTVLAVIIPTLIAIGFLINAYITL